MNPKRRFFGLSAICIPRRTAIFYKWPPPRPRLGPTGGRERPRRRTPPVIATYQERLHVEDENRILVRAEGMVDSGYEWYWEEFKGNARNYPVDLRDLAPGPIQIGLGFWGWTGGSHQFALRWNTTEVDQLAFSGPSYQVLSATVEAGTKEGINHLGLVHVGGGLVRFDAFDLAYRRRLMARNGVLAFDGPAGQGLGRFELTGFAQEQPRVFAVGEGLTEIVGFSWADQRLVFQDSLKTVPQRYIAALASQLKEARWSRSG